MSDPLVNLHLSDREKGEGLQKTYVGSSEGTKIPIQSAPPMLKMIKRNMIVLKARAIVFLGCFASPAIIEMYSGPPMVNVAMMMALMNDLKRLAESSPTHGAGSFQCRNPNLLDGLALGLGEEVRDLLVHRVTANHDDEGVNDHA